MSDRFHHVAQRRKLIDRRALVEVLDELGADERSIAQKRQALVVILRDALKSGTVEIAARLDTHPSAGHQAAAAQAFLIDQLIRLLYDFTVKWLYPNNNPTSAERITIIAVGGYGRGEMAPYSDVDIGFLIPWKPTGWTEQVIESMLYVLWDMGLKVGQSVRSLDEMIRMAQSDLTARTALLEARYVWGDETLYKEASLRFDSEIVKGTGKQFVADKLAERDERHKRMGDSRYVVEPNVKEGKGGLRDLHTLFWIGKYVFQVKSVAELVPAGLLTEQELRQFTRAENFLWAVRCHLHLITRRAEDRLTFDVQRELAARMRYADRPGKSAVERFMQHYFLQAKMVGDLTGVFLAHLDDQLAKKGARFMPSIITNFRRRPGKLNGFVLDRGRLSIPDDRFFASDPVRMVELFQLADKHGLEIHPQAMRAAARDAKLIDNDVRDDPRANALFMDVLCSRRDPETVLRWMNEATVFGRFVPDFGRVVAQMQFDMYHHYTVDEHSIRAIGLLSRIERGEFHEDHPLATAIFSQLASRRVIFVAVLLHDIAKGRRGDHSVLGAEVALRLSPRLGLTPAETETVSWLVRYHLLMSATAFKRDLADYKTILDFAQVVASPERLRLLLLLTVVDIRAVGPGVWNSWKRQLLTELFDAGEELLRLGHKERGREQRIAQRKEALEAELGLCANAFADHAKQFPESYWIAEASDVIAQNARLMLSAGDAPLAIAATVYPDRGATLVQVYAADHPGLFYRIAGAIHLAGGNIIDARIHTTRSGMAVDNFLVQDAHGQPFAEESQLDRLKQAIEDAVASRHKITSKLEAKPLAHPRAEAFHIEPAVMVTNEASNRFTVVEINTRDRPALLSNLAQALFESKIMVHSAHVATYGERAVDTFYLTDLTGAKIESRQRLASMEKRLLEAATGPGEKAEAA